MWPPSSVTSCTRYPPGGRSPPWGGPAADWFRFQPFEALRRIGMFVVCGEALMDVYTGEWTATGMTLDARIGGSPLNVAQGLARLERPVAFLAALSTDACGERLLASLRA